MDFKKYRVVYLLIILVAGLFVATRLFPNINLFKLNQSVIPSASPQSSTTTDTLDVVINFGDKTLENKDVKAENAYGALVDLAKKENLEIKTKQYDFGIFIESIGGFANSKDKAWIYYVNGVSGDVAADKKIVNSGDKVEWKYEKPIF